jgi:hypothetical protein
MTNWRQNPPRLHELANSITAGDICQPITLTFDAETRCKDAYKEWDDLTIETNSDLFDHIAIITKDDAAVGWIDCTGLHAEEIIADLQGVIEPLTIRNLISADTPLLDVAKLYGPDSPDVFVVIHANQPIGWIGYPTLLGAPFQACLFSLILSVEFALGKIVETDAALAFSQLARPRQSIAIRIAKLRGYPHPEGEGPSERQLLRCTTLADKVRILKNRPLTAASLPTYNENLLEKAERLRNALAHPTDVDEISKLIPKGHISEFLTGIAAFESDLYKAISSGLRLH